MDRHYLGLDLGTSGCRAVVIDATNKPVAYAEREFPEPIRQGNHVEQDPTIWWVVVRQVLAECAENVDMQQIRAIAVDGTSATTVLIDQHGRPQGHALMYNDARAQIQAAQIQAVATQHGVDAGACGVATSSLAKLCWYLEDDSSAKRFYITHQADWIAGQLSQRFHISDANNCLKLGYDSRRMDWHEWLSALSIPVAMFPTVLPSGSRVGSIRADLGNELNLNAATQIIVGTTDSTASVIATGAVECGDAITTLGSSLVLKIICASPYDSARYGVYSQPLFNHWLVGGASNSGGAVLKHYFSDQQIEALTQQVKPNTDTGLDYYPLLSPGERFPIYDTNLTPNMSPRPKDDLTFFQGILEGIAKIEKMGYDRLCALGAPYPARIITMGGGAKNTAWCQMRERILGVPVAAAKIQDAAFGAALLAKIGSEKKVKGSKVKD